MMLAYRPSRRLLAFTGSRADAEQDCWLVCYWPQRDEPHGMLPDDCECKSAKRGEGGPVPPARNYYLSLALALIPPSPPSRAGSRPADEPVSEPDAYLEEVPLHRRAACELDFSALLAPRCRAVRQPAKPAADVLLLLEPRRPPLRPVTTSAHSVVAPTAVWADDAPPLLETAAPLPSYSESFEELLQRLFDLAALQPPPEHALRADGDSRWSQRAGLPAKRRRKRAPLPWPVDEPRGADTGLLDAPFCPALAGAPALLDVCDVRDVAVPPARSPFAGRRLSRLVDDGDALVCPSLLDLFSSIKPLPQQALALFSRPVDGPLDWLQAGIAMWWAPAVPRCYAWSDAGRRSDLAAPTVWRAGERPTPAQQEEEEWTRYYRTSTVERTVDLASDTSDRSELELELIASAMASAGSERRWAYYAWLEQLHASAGLQRYDQLVDDLCPAVRRAVRRERRLPEQRASVSALDPLDVYLMTSGAPPAATVPATRDDVVAGLGALPFEIELARRIAGAASTSNCCMVLDASVPTAAIAFLAVRGVADAYASALWITADDEAHYHRLLVARCLDTAQLAVRVSVRGWSEVGRLAARPGFGAEHELVVAQRYQAEHAGALLSLAPKRLLLLACWPARTSSELYATMQRLGVARLLPCKLAALPATVARRLQVKHMPLDGGAAQLVRLAMDSASRCFQVLVQRDLVPADWLSSGPGQDEFELLTDLLVLHGDAASVGVVLELHCLIGAVQRLLHSGCVDAHRYVEAYRGLPACAELARLRAGLQQLAGEVLAGVRADFFERALGVVREQCSPERYRNSLVVVDTVPADCRPDGHDVLLVRSRLGFEQLCQLAASCGRSTVVASWRDLPDVDELFGGGLLTLWPFDQVVDTTMRWAVYPALARELVKEPASRQVHCVRIKPHTPPQLADVWIDQFLDGCPAGTVEEIAYLDYEIVFGARAPVGAVPAHAFFDPLTSTVKSTFFK